MPLFCPLADNVGNVADWTAAVVSFVSALAVVFLSIQANRTARASKQIAELQTGSVLAERSREGRLLLNFLAAEFASAGGSAHVAHHSVGMLNHDDGPMGIYTRTTWENAVKYVEAINLSLSESKYDRLHILPDHLADAVGRVLGHKGSVLNSLREAAQVLDIAPDFRPGPGTLAYSVMDDVRNEASKAIAGVRVDLETLVQAARAVGANV